MENLVSIIIPVYNREDLVSKAIQSAIDQTYSNIEVIIVDNNSTDRSWDIIEKYVKIDNRIKAFRNEINIGPVKNWLKGLHLSKGEYVKILFSDDWIDTSFVEKTIKILENNSDVGFVISKVEILQYSKSFINYKISNKSEKIVSDAYIDRYFKLKNNLAPVSPGCALFRRNDIVNSLIAEIPNPFNIEYSKHGAGPDLLLYLMNAKKYKYIYYIDECLSFFYGSKNSFTLNNNLILPYSYAKVFFLNESSNYHIKYRIILLLKLIKDLHVNFRIVYYFLRKNNK